jgi:peptidoglycan hydrolase-like protein with peptidoglycan-binding domain
MLNKFVAANITPNGFYGPATKDAVKAFQNKYSDETLAPWGVTEATGIVSFTTLKKLNELNCGEQFELSPLEKYLINQFKNNPAPVTPEGTSTSTTPEGTAVPIEVGAAPRTPLDENDIQTASVIDTGVTGSLFKKIGDFFKKNF